MDGETAEIETRCAAFLHVPLFSTSDRQHGVVMTAHAQSSPSHLIMAYRCSFNAAIEHLYSSDPEEQKEGVVLLTYLSSSLVLPDSEQAPFDIEALSEQALVTLGAATFWLGVLKASGVQPDLVSPDERGARLLMQASALTGSLYGHLAMAFRYETGYLEEQNCDSAYAHLKVRHAPH